MFRICLLVICTLFLSGCGALFDSDNAPTPKPLTSFKAEVMPQTVWTANTGNGAGGEHLIMAPVIDGPAIYTASANGNITSVSKLNGQVNWSNDTKLSLTSGPGAGNGIVVAGSRTGDIIALNANDGSVRWKKHVNSEILANPVVSNDKILIKSIDGLVRAYSIDGKRAWIVQQTEPNLILRGSSSPAVSYNDAIIGFANGRLIKVHLLDGKMMWSQTIAYPQGAFSIERMIDIDADPVVHAHHVFAATYQGKIASLSWTSGKTLWSHDLSSYTGMAADNNNVYVSDAKSFLWSFNADSGLVNWRLGKLEARHISGPATMDNYIVVGDSEGYLHWVDKKDGHFAGRIKASGPIVTSPIAQNGVLYALSSNGYLSAYKI